MGTFHPSKWTAGFLVLILFLFVARLRLSATELREATFTQVVNRVEVTNPSGTDKRPAQVQSKFAAPDIIRTAENSRAELTAADQTITRVGANTIFSFKPEGRGINLQQGSLLFNSPTGRGGGTIQTAAATASVLGTTIIVSTTKNGGFKLLVIEGKARATLPNGRSLDLKAGQMTFILPGMTRMPQVLEFRLSKQGEGSLLLGGFTQALPAQDKITAAVATQNEAIASGNKTDTNLLVGEVVNGNEIQIVDPNTVQIAMRNDPYADLIAKFKQAVAVDRSVSSSILDSSNTIYVPSAAALTAVANAVGDTTSHGTMPATSYVFAANNLSLSGSVDLSPYEGVESFIFYGQQSISMTSMSFGTYSGEIILHSSGALTTSSLINAHAAALRLELNGPLVNVPYMTNTGGSISVRNDGGSIYVQSGASVSGVATNKDPAIQLDAATFIDINNATFGSSGVTGSTGLDIRAGSYLNFAFATFNSPTQNAFLQAQDYLDANTFTISANIAEISAATGTATLSNASVTAGTVTVSAVVGTLNLVSGTFTASSTLTAKGATINADTTAFESYGSGTASFLGSMTSSATTTSNAITMNNVSFNGFTSVSMAAYTINLSDVSFATGQTVNLTSGVANPGGYPTFGAGNAVPGRVNFINNVSYGGNVINSTTTFDSYGSNIHLNQ